VDNNSQDNTCQIIEKFEDLRIRFFRKEENTGFCGGHNFTISNSSTEFVLLVNPDIIMCPEYIEKALKIMETDAKIGTVAGLLVRSEVTDPNCLIDSAGMQLKRSGIMRLRFHEKKLSHCQLIQEKVFGADGALPLYRRSMIQDISYQGEFFDELFFAHKEDWDISWRSHLHGWKTVFDPICIAIHPRHFKPQSIKVRNNVTSDIKVHSVKNQIILLLKNKDLGSFIIDSVFIISRQFLIFLYILLFERSSLKAYQFVFRNMRLIIAKRKAIQSRRV
jgi:GT2 family glycosyltransferase